MPSHAPFVPFGMDSTTGVTIALRLALQSAFGTVQTSPGRNRRRKLLFALAFSIIAGLKLLASTASTSSPIEGFYTETDEPIRPFTHTTTTPVYRTPSRTDDLIIPSWGPIYTLVIVLFGLIAAGGAYYLLSGRAGLFTSFSSGSTRHRHRTRARSGRLVSISGDHSPRRSSNNNQGDISRSKSLKHCASGAPPPPPPPPPSTTCGVHNSPLNGWIAALTVYAHLARMAGNKTHTSLSVAYSMRKFEPCVEWSQPSAQRLESNLNLNPNLALFLPASTSEPSVETPASPELSVAVEDQDCSLSRNLIDTSRISSPQDVNRIVPRCLELADITFEPLTSSFFIVEQGDSADSLCHADNERATFYHEDSYSITSINTNTPAFDDSRSNNGIYFADDEDTTHSTAYSLSKATDDYTNSESGCLKSALEFQSAEEGQLDDLTFANISLDATFLNFSLLSGCRHRFSEAPPAGEEPFELSQIVDSIVTGDWDASVTDIPPQVSISVSLTCDHSGLEGDTSVDVDADAILEGLSCLQDVVASVSAPTHLDDSSLDFFANAFQLGLSDISLIKDVELTHISLLSVVDDYTSNDDLELKSCDAATVSSPKKPVVIVQAEAEVITNTLALVKVEGDLKRDADEKEPPFVFDPRNYPGCTLYNLHRYGVRKLDGSTPRWSLLGYETPPKVPRVVEEIFAPPAAATSAIASETTPAIPLQTLSAIPVKVASSGIPVTKRSAIPVRTTTSSSISSSATSVSSPYLSASSVSSHIPCQAGTRIPTYRMRPSTRRASQASDATSVDLDSNTSAQVQHGCDHGLDAQKVVASPTIQPPAVPVDKDDPSAIEGLGDNEQGNKPALSFDWMNLPGCTLGNLRRYGVRKLDGSTPRWSLLGTEPLPEEFPKIPESKLYSSSRFSKLEPPSHTKSAFTSLPSAKVGPSLYKMWSPNAPLYKPERPGQGVSFDLEYDLSIQVQIGCDESVIVKTEKSQISIVVIQPNHVPSDQYLEAARVRRVSSEHLHPETAHHRLSV